MTPLAGPADLTRRAAVGLLAAGGLGFALFGPRGAGHVNDGRIVLNYWEKWTGLEGRAMHAVVDRFNESQSRIRVRYLATAAIDQKTLIAIAGKAPPDIVGLWNYNLPAYAESRAILPLDDLLAPWGVKVENYAAGVRPVMTYGGQTWGAVNTGGTLALYYNRGMFKEAGLDPDRPPRTIPEFEAVNEKLMLSDPDGTIRRMGFHHREPGWWSFIWGNYFGGALTDDAGDRSATTATMTAPGNVAAYRWVQSYPERFGLTRLNAFRSTFANYDAPLNAFLSGRLGMVVQGPWLANVINAYAKDLDYGVAPMVVAEGLYREDEPVGLIDTDIIVIPAGVRHPEASAEFLAYTQRQDNVEYLSTVHCKNSPLAVSSEGFLANHPNRGVRVFDAIAKSPRAYRCPTTRTWLQLKDEMDKSFDAIWNLREGAGRVLAGVEARSQAILDRSIEQSARRRAVAGATGATGGRA